MQNFTTILRNDLIHDKQIYLPAGKATLTLIDVCDIGAVATCILANISSPINKSYELTYKEKLTFSEMAEKPSSNLGIDIQFKSPNLVSFFLKKKMPTMLILVMIMLHYFIGFEKEPEITKWVKKKTNRQATTFKQFINDNRKLLIK